MSLEILPSIKEESLRHNGTSSIHSRLSSTSKETPFPPFVFSLICTFWFSLSFMYNNHRFFSIVNTDHLDNAAWTVLYLLNVIRDKSYNLSRFPYQEGKVGEWFTENTPGKLDHATGTVYMLNLNQKSELYPIELNRDGTVKPPNVESPNEEGTNGFKVVCHGTSHDSAKAIFESGIRLCKSNEEGDFCMKYGKGFYLTDFQKAQEWGFANWGAKVAVFVFRIPNEEIEKYKGKDLINIAEEDDDNQELDFIEAPWYKRGRGRRMPSDPEAIPDTYQMCILSTELAQTVYKSLHSVVFYNTSRR